MAITIQEIPPVTDSSSTKDVSKAINDLNANQKVLLQYMCSIEERTEKLENKSCWEQNVNIGTIV